MLGSLNFLETCWVRVLEAFMIINLVLFIIVILQYIQGVFQNIEKKIFQVSKCRFSDNSYQLVFKNDS